MVPILVSGDLLFDQSGIIYGTTQNGGPSNVGVVFSLMPTQGTWVENVLYNFTRGNDGYYPLSGVIFDSSGNVYGTATNGGSGGGGTVYELMPSGSGWQEMTLWSFPGNGYGYGPYPAGGLIFDGSGNLNGTTVATTYGPQGMIYELSPSNGSWTIINWYDFSGDRLSQGPVASLVIDAGGNLYGTQVSAGDDNAPGVVFKISAGWASYTPLYVFSGKLDGGHPECSPVLDANGNIYGTAAIDGANGFGTVWEITP
jgi:uncharacterized repeat protein (TIGR03803 family)